MNKKFSTLAVAAMLASAFTAYAGPGDVVTKLAEGNNGKQYQLRAIVGTAERGYLTLDENDGALKLTPAASLSEIGESLWCVNVTLENQGKNPIFDFTNKAYGALLDVTVGGWADWTNGISGNEAHVGGEISGWEFAPILGSKDVNMFGKDGDADSFAASAATPTAGYNVYALYSYVNSTHVATLIYDADNKVKVKVVKADETANIANQIKFFLQEAYPVDLTAEQFNSILNTQDKDKGTVKMTFDKDYNNTDVINPFSTNEFRADNVVGAYNDCDASGSSIDCDVFNDKHNFVYLYKTEADGTKNYLHVDTAYANGFGTKFLTFNFNSFKKRNL